MKHQLRRSTTILLAGILTAFLLLASFFVLGRPAIAANESGRLITIHDRGEETVLVSEASTVADALKEADIILDERDTVEPSLTEALIASEYQINIYRARPVTIIDGPMRQKIVTPFQTASQIAKDAGVVLYPEDQTTLMRSDDYLLDGAGLQLIVDRATLFTFNLYGTTTQARTQAATVGEMLDEKGIVLGEAGRSSLPLSTPITSGLAVSVWREGKQTVSAEESIPFQTEQIRDADRDVGYRAVQTPGQNGSRTVTYEIEIKDGQEVSRTEIASVIVSQPVKQVETIGIKAKILVNYSPDKAAIMSAAGVAAEDQGYAAYIINNENAGWCPIRWQGTTSCWVEYAEKFPGAEVSSQVGYGLCQATPGIKMASAGADWRTNIVTQMKWCHNYAIGRYGSWEKAYNFKVSRGWW